MQKMRTDDDIALLMPARRCWQPSASPVSRIALADAIKRSRVWELVGVVIATVSTSSSSFAGSAMVGTAHTMPALKPAAPAPSVRLKRAAQVLQGDQVRELADAPLTVEAGVLGQAVALALRTKRSCWPPLVGHARFPAWLLHKAVCKNLGHARCDGR
jgi:hypothetical protein